MLQRGWTLKLLHLNLIRIAKLTSGTRSGKNILKLWRLTGEQETQAELEVRKVRVLRRSHNMLRKEPLSRKKAELEPLARARCRRSCLVLKHRSEVLLASFEDKRQGRD